MSSRIEQFVHAGLARLYPQDLARYEPQNSILDQLSSVIQNEGNNLSDLIQELHPDQTTLNSALFIAAKSGNADAIWILVTLGVDPVTIDHLKNTPLHYAAENGHLGAIEALIQIGNLNTTSKTENIPGPRRSSRRRQTITISFLLMDQPGDIGRSPLAIAILNNQWLAVETLLRLGSQALLKTDNNGKTVIHLVCERGYKVLLEDLLRMGQFSPEFIDANDKKKNTAFLTARWFQNISKERYLI